MRAFVLSGGASLGAIQVGMLRALYERDIQPDLLVGASVGAINAAFLASREQTPWTADELADVWAAIRRSDIFPLSALGGLRGLLGIRSHLVSAGSLRRILERELEFDRLEEAPLALHIVAVDLMSGNEILLSSGPVIDAVLGSAAIPGVFEAVPFGDVDLIDGRVANNTPISEAVHLGADEVYVLPTGTACALQSAPRGALATVLHATSLLIQRRLIEDIERYRDEVKLIVLPPLCPLTVLPVDFSHTRELIARALDATRAFIDEGGLDRPPIRMSLHSHGHRTARQRSAVA